MARREDLYSYNDIRNLSEDWTLDERNGKPYSGESVQKFIKTFCQMSVDNEQTKVGAIYFDTQAMKLYAFKSEEDRQAFVENGDVSLILGVQDVVFSGTQKKLTIINKMSGSTVYFTTNSDSAEITVAFESKEKDINASEWTDVIEDAYFTVAVDKGATGNYVNIIENRLVKNGESFTFDVLNYISSGSNRVKVTAVGAVSGQTANYGYSVVLTSMYIAPANFAWYTPFIEGNSYSLGGVNIGGALSKTLFVKISDERNYSRTYEKNIGDAVYITNPFYFTELEFPTNGTGIYNVEMWVQAEELQSDHLSYNIMCVAKADVFTAQLCCISNVLDTAVNYSDNSLFDFAVYNGGASTASPHIKLTAVVNTNPMVLVDENLASVATGISVAYKYNLEVETEETNVKLDAVLTFGNEQKAVYAIDNSASFPATQGAVFYLNAANRNNSQENRTFIVNEVTKDCVVAEWTNMSWVDGTDGWTVDDNGRKCLLLPARTKAVVNYNPLSSFGVGKTLEFTFKVANASDYKESVLSLCDNADDDKFRGVRITPDNILVHSRDLNTDDENQSYDYPEDTLMNVCISVIRNYNTNYGNICIIYVNGVRKKEFAFTNADSWITESAKIILGSETADLYVYNIRVYESGFGSQDALKNYISSLPGAKDKSAASALIDSVIDDSYSVDYDKTKAVANVATIEMLNGGEIPHYGLSKEYTAQCNLEVSFNEHPEWNWSIDNIKIEGQGTTSMNYFRWNLRWRLDKSTGFTVHTADGGTSTDDALYFDGPENHPKISRMTAKINYASSMQSHKIGATGAYSELHHHLGLDNETGERVSVFQRPFYFFEKKLLEGTQNQYSYTFIGLFTFGSDKGDKATFGYDNAEYEDTLLVLEGLDHPIKGCGMDYPWSGMRYVADEESLCVDKGDNSYDSAWEVSQPGSAESEEEIQAKLDAEFKPAYEAAYMSSTKIIGTDESLESINADVDAWGLRTDEEGHAYQLYEFWIDGEYELYYLSKKTNLYEKNGVNLLTQLGISEEELSGLDIKAKNELFKARRRERFKSEMQNYWDLDDCLYCYCFLLLFGATDNFKKNSYPYKLGTLASGSRWRWRQDDLDTLFDIDNQGLAVKGYSIEAHDWTDEGKTAYVFKGEDSVFWSLLDECYDVELKAMGNRILGAMYELSTSGSNTLDRLMGYVNRVFWDNAQNYFTKSAYNSDAEYKYEEAWPKYASGDYDVDVHPLAQSLGDHIEAERNWVRNRLIYMMSKWGYGPFAQYTDSSLGRINFRTQLAQSFTLTPAMDLYPCILSGQGAVHASGERVKAGEEVRISGVGGTNTNVYIMASDELESIGDLCTLTVDSATNAGISVASKRLRTLKVGDDVAEKVTSNLQQLTVGQCNSLESINARNLKTLTGTIDLSRCPRLKEALFAGTDLRSVTLANGSKITRLELSDATTVLELLNLAKLTELDYTALSKLEFFRVENTPNINPFEVLKEVYNLDGSSLRDIRLTGFSYTGVSADVDLLANLAEDRDKDGQPHNYNGIGSDGVADAGMLPVIEGNVTIKGNAYEDSINTIKSYFPNLSLMLNGLLYFRFADAEVNRIIAENWGDGVGTTTEDINNITVLNGKFTGNTNIRNFDELQNFERLDLSPNGSFRECANLVSAKLPEHVKIIGENSFYRCTSLTNINLPSSLTELRLNCFAYVPARFNIDLPNLEKLEQSSFTSSGVETVTNLGKITNIDNGDTSYGVFNNCGNLTSVILPSTLKHLGNYTFFKCLKLTNVVISEGLSTIGVTTFGYCPFTKIELPSTITRIEDYCFSQCTNLSIVKISAVEPPILGGDKVFNNTDVGLKIYVPDDSVEAYKTATNWSAYADKIHPISEYVEQ